MASLAQTKCAREWTATEVTCTMRAMGRGWQDPVEPARSRMVSVGGHDS